MIKVNGLNRITRLLDRLPQRVKAEVVMEFQASTEEIRSSAVKDAPKNIGKLSNSIVVSRSSTGLSQTVGVTVGYGAIMEWGTKKKMRVPGVLSAYAAQFKGAPVGAGTGNLNDAILKWVQRKGIGAKRTKSGRISRSKDAKANMKSVAFVIARSIRRNGVAPHPYFFKHVFRVQKRLEQRLTKLIPNA